MTEVAAAERAESKGESLNRYIVNSLTADIDRSQIDDLKDILALVMKSLEALKGQINSYAPTIANTYVGISDVIARGTVGNWIGTQMLVQPNCIFEGQGLFAVLGSQIEAADAQSDFSTQTRRLAK